jgi:methyltransferase
MTLLGASSRLLYTLLIAAVAAQRLWELRLAARHRRALLARGGVEAAPGHYRAMVLLHTAFLAACPLEVWLLRRPFRPALGLAMAVLLAAAAALRIWVIRTLGERWTTRIVVLPGVAPLAGGPYRFLRHPNYLAVAVEMAALPLLHGAWLSALVFSAANALVLAVRIPAEDAALGRGSRGGGAEATRARSGAGEAASGAGAGAAMAGSGPDTAASPPAAGGVAMSGRLRAYRNGEP